MDLKSFRILTLAYPETVELPHFDKTSFRVKKKIFATYDAATDLVCLKFSEAIQDVFATLAPSIIYPVPNKWGKQGWTYVRLSGAPDELIKDALRQAYIEVAPSNLADQFRETIEGTRL